MRSKKINREIILARLDISMCIRMSKEDDTMLKYYWIEKLNIKQKYLELLLNEKEINKFQEVLNGTNKSNKRFK